MKKIEKLPAAELDVMVCLWKFSQPVRTAVITEELSASHSWTQSTIKALLSRLEDKGFLSVTRQGRFTLYQATIKEADYRKKETKSLLTRYYNNSVKNLITALINDDNLSSSELAELEAIIKNAGDKNA